MDTDDTVMLTAQVLLAILFAAQGPVSKRDVTKKLKLPRATLDKSLSLLKSKLSEAPFDALVLLEIEDDRLVLLTNPEFGDFIKLIDGRSPQKLSPEALETLTIVAYRQPVSKSEIDALRAVDSEKTLTSLSAAGFIEALADTDSPGHPSLFVTTERFLISMGLKSLAELPRLEGLERI